MPTARSSRLALRYRREPRQPVLDQPDAAILAGPDQLIGCEGWLGPRDLTLTRTAGAAFPPGHPRAGQAGSLWPSGTEGRAQWGGVSDNCTVGRRWRSVPAGAWLSVDHRASSSAVNSWGTSLSSASGTSPRPTSQRPVCASEIRTSQLPPSRARRPSATIAPNAIR